MEYPTFCRSLYCGYTTEDQYCREQCSTRPELDAYRAWLARVGTEEDDQAQE
jgi:hypothetical protein